MEFLGVVVAGFTRSSTFPCDWYTRGIVLKLNSLHISLQTYPIFPPALTPAQGS